MVRLAGNNDGFVARSKVSLQQGQHKLHLGICMKSAFTMRDSDEELEQLRNPSSNIQVYFPNRLKAKPALLRVYFSTAGLVSDGFTTQPALEA